MEQNIFARTGCSIANFNTDLIINLDAMVQNLSQIELCQELGCSFHDLTNVLVAGLEIPVCILIGL